MYLQNQYTISKSRLAFIPQTFYRDFAFRLLSGSFSSFINCPTFQKSDYWPAGTHPTASCLVLYRATESTADGIQRVIRDKHHGMKVLGNEKSDGADADRLNARSHVGSA